MNNKSTKTYPGADVNSDHNPVVKRMEVKLKSNNHTKTNKEVQGTENRCYSPKKHGLYVAEMKNTYECLPEESTEKYRKENPREKINNKKEYVQVRYGDDLLQKEQKTMERWMTDEILIKMERMNTEKEHCILHNIEKEKWLQRNRRNNKIEKQHRPREMKKQAQIREPALKKKKNVNF